MESSQKNIQKDQEENLPIGQQILKQLIQMNNNISSMDGNITKLNTTLNSRMERMEGKIDKLLDEKNKKQEEPKMQPKEDQKIEIKNEDDTKEEKKIIVDGKHINPQNVQVENLAPLKIKDTNKMSDNIERNVDNEGNNTINSKSNKSNGNSNNPQNPDELVNLQSLTHSSKHSEISVDVTSRRNTDRKKKIDILYLRNKNQSLRNANQKHEKGNMAQTLNIAKINKKSGHGFEQKMNFEKKKNKSNEKNSKRTKQLNKGKSSSVISMTSQAKGKRAVIEKMKAPLLPPKKIKNQYLANLSIKIDPKLYLKKKNGK